MKIKVPILLYMVFCLSGIFDTEAQSVSKLYREAEKIFYNENYEKSLELYQAIEQIIDYKDISYKIEICKLLSDNSYNDMTIFNDYEVERVLGDGDLFYYYRGIILMKKYEFEQAALSFKRCIVRVKNKNKNKTKLEKAQRLLVWATAAKNHIESPKSYEILSLGGDINTEKAELSPVYFSNKRELLFLSNRDDTQPNNFQIYHTTNEGDNEWSLPQLVTNIGTFARNNANIEVVAEDGRLFHFREEKGGDLFYSDPTENKSGWSIPKEFDSKISSTHLSSHFFINEYEDRIIFAKNVGSRKKPDLDLFESFRNHETREWSKPELFATTINSVFNEDSPYLSPNEQTLYFASDGHETMGGYDIFKSEFDSATLSWSEPINMGLPINSPEDEKHFKLLNNQNYGYFTSNRLQTIGDYDIFFFWKKEKQNKLSEK